MSFLATSYVSFELMTFYKHAKQLLTTD